MKPQTLVAAAGVVVSLVLTLQGATFAYVLRTEARLTRMETIIDMQRPAVRVPAPGEKVRT